MVNLMNITYTQIWVNDGPEAVLKECFRRAALQGYLNQRADGLYAHMCIGTYGLSYEAFTKKPFLTGYSGFRHVSQEWLKTRKYFVTLWDYRPGITLIDCVHDVRNHCSRSFENDFERELIEAKGVSETARLNTAIHTPFDGVW